MNNNQSISHIKIKQELRQGSVKYVNIAFQYKSFEQSSIEKAINLITYGILVRLYQKQNEEYVVYKQVLLFINPDQLHQLFLLDKRSQQLFSIALYDIITLNIDEPKKLFQSDSCLFIQFKSFTIILEFSNQSQRDYLHQAIQHFCIQESYKLQFLNYIQFIKTQVISTIGHENHLDIFQMEKILKKFRLSFPAIKHLLLHPNETSIIFIQDSSFSQSGLSLKEFCERLPKVLIKEEVRDIFLKYTANPTHDDFEGSMNFEEFRKFLEIEQNLILSNQTFEDLAFSLQNNNLISFINFSEYLFSVNNEIQDQGDQYLDLELPLNEYYINSATKIFEYNMEGLFIMQQYQNVHEGLKPILYVLLRGVRHIELEIWEGQDSLPVCLYGPMQNYQIDVNQVFQLLKDYAFKFTKLPLLICIEDHCSLDVKKKLMECFHKHFGFSIIQSQEMFNFNISSLPRLKDLMEKIIIYGPVRLQDKVVKKKQESKQDEEGILQKNSNIAYYMQSNTYFSENRNKNFMIHSAFKKTSQNEKIHEQEYREANYYSLNFIKKQLILNGYQNLFTLFQLQTDQQIIDKSIIYTSNDQIFQNILQNKKQKISQKINSEIFADQSSHQSDNLQILEQKFINEITLCADNLFKWSASPQEYYNIDASQGYYQNIQMVMIKHHQIDFNYLYSYAMFDGYNGQMKGFIARAQKQQINCKRGSMSLFSQRSQSQIVQLMPPLRFLLLKLISGRQLRKERNDKSLFVQVILREPVDCDVERIQQEITDRVIENTFNPIFNKEMAFELNSKNFFSVLMFLVYDDGQVLYWNSIAVRNLKEGYSVVPLLDQNLNPVFNTQLFLKMMIK